jgi:hypothetical protein
VRMDAVSLAIGCDPSVTLTLGWHGESGWVKARHGGEGIVGWEREKGGVQGGVGNQRAGVNRRKGVWGEGEDNREKRHVSRLILG